MKSVLYWFLIYIITMISTWGAHGVAFALKGGFDKKIPEVIEWGTNFDAEGGEIFYAYCEM